MSQSPSFQDPRFIRHLNYTSCKIPYASIYLKKGKKEIGYRFRAKVSEVQKNFDSWRAINRSGTKAAGYRLSIHPFPPIGYRGMEVKKCSWWSGVNRPISCLTRRACSKIENLGPVRMNWRTQQRNLPLFGIHPFAHVNSALRTMHIYIYSTNRLWG